MTLLILVYSFDRYSMLSHIIVEKECLLILINKTREHRIFPVFRWASHIVFNVETIAEHYMMQAEQKMQ